MFRNIIMLICWCLPTSCLTTLQPLVTMQNAVTETRITGTWQSDKNSVTITPMNKDTMADDLNQLSTRSLNDNSRLDPAFNDKLYHIYFEKNGIGYHMTGALTKINGNLFMQLAPATIGDHEKPDGSGYEMTFDFFPTYTIAKLKMDNNSLKIDFLNGDFIKEQIETGRMRVKHENDVLFGTFVITASSNELSQFLEKYGKDERLFNTKNSITLTRKGSV